MQGLAFVTLGGQSRRRLANITSAITRVRYSRRREISRLALALACRIAIVERAISAISLRCY